MEYVHLAIAYMTATTICARLMQAETKELSFSTIVSVVRGLLNFACKPFHPLRRKILSWMCYNRKKERNNQLTTMDGSLFIAYQTLISIITKITSVIFCSAVAYLLTYYYDESATTRERYDWYSLARKMVIRCSIAIGIELIFNIIALKIQTCLYKIPVISVWKWKWKSILVIHVIQVMFIMLLFSQYVNNILSRDFYMEVNGTCIGFFKRA